MKPEEQRVAIAEACGWKWWKFKRKDGSEFTQIVRVEAWPSSAHYGGMKCARPVELDHTATPDYLNDLNEMHHAVKNLRPDEANKWVAELIRIVAFGANPHWNRDYHVANATAAQRAEAFLRTIGKWIE